MIESYKDSIEEFKRVDHLFYVTLKYTRTVDVIRSTVERMIATFEAAIDCILKVMKEEKIIEDIPANPVGKGNLAREICTDEMMCSSIELYLKLRKLMRCEYTKREEYRRHVTMSAQMDEEVVEINIDVLKEYYDYLTEFLRYTKKRIEPYKDMEE